MSERGAVAQCDNGIDDDGDGLVDFHDLDGDGDGGLSRANPGCLHPTGLYELIDGSPEPGLREPGLAVGLADRAR